MMKAYHIYLIKMINSLCFEVKHVAQSFFLQKIVQELIFEISCIKSKIYNNFWDTNEPLLSLKDVIGACKLQDPYVMNVQRYQNQQLDYKTWEISLPNQSS